MFPRRRPRHPFHEVHPDVFELRSDQTEAEEKDPEVVLGAGRIVRPLVFRARAGRTKRLGRDREAKNDVRLDLAGVGRAVEKAELDRAHAPDVVEVDRAVAGVVVVGRIRIRVTEPCSVQVVAGGRFHPLKAADELAVGALGVGPEAALKGSGGLEDQLLLLVENPREVRNLARGEILDADVNVLAGAFRGLGPGAAQGANHRLKGIKVVPFQNRGDHLGARGAVGQAAVADRLPMPPVRRDHRPFVIRAAGVGDLSADHRVNRLGRAFAADVRILQFRPEGQGLRRLDRVGHFRLHRLAVDRFAGRLRTAPVYSDIYYH